MTKLAGVVLVVGVLAGCNAGAPRGAATPRGDAIADVSRSGPPGTGTAPLACRHEVGLVCIEGLQDGCALSPPVTLYHVCVAADATAGPPCANEIALQCPEGWVDACLLTPQLAASHVCVRAQR